MTSKDSTARARLSPFAALALGYATGLLVWEALRWTPLVDWWLFELVDIFGLWLYLPLPLLLVLAALRRRWRLAVYLLLPLLVLSWDLGLHERLDRPAASGPALRVMASNLVYTNADVASVRAVVAREQPDVVAMVELGRSMANGLAAELAAAYPHQALYPRGDTTGFGLLSRYPILDVEPPERRGFECYCFLATLDVQGWVVNVLVVHPFRAQIRARRFGPIPVPLRFDTSRQDPSLDAILHRVAQTDGPLVALGDFNVGDRQPYYREFLRLLRDAHRQAGTPPGFTYPSNETSDGIPIPPLVRIDHVFHDDRLVAEAMWTGNLPSSDHRYVVADLRLR